MSKEHEQEYVQTEYFCESCDTNHFGNCPKIKVTLTTYTHTDTEELERDEAMTPTEQDNEQRFYEPDDIDDLVVWTLPCADCGEVGCPYMYGEDRKELEERLRALITADRKRVALEARIDELMRERKNDYWPYYSDKADSYNTERIAELKAQQEEV